LDQLGCRFATDDVRVFMRGPLGSNFDYRILADLEVPTPLERVVSLNIMRRHLNSEQKRDLIAELLKDAPDRSDRDTARVVGVDNKTVGSVRRKLEGAGEIPTVTETVGRDGRIRTIRPQRGVPPTPVKDRDPRTPMERLKEELAVAKRTISRYENNDSGPLVTRNSSASEIAQVVYEWMTPSKRTTFWQAFGQRLKATAAAVDATDKPVSKPPSKAGDLPEDQKAAIREARKAGKSFKDIAAEHEIFQDQVRTICRGE
jgi:hypothetical protein